ncbi:MAG: hypothetical protein K940chlam1_01105 [Candidatus Anoxychlamydiales bacterium]|nr:hypothetical protein [Candidatus Anoxychlamydiales bacterium]NGX36419.1 hypothetical protein [Candidatus Anoxychlamydiales bacterium]
MELIYGKRKMKTILTFFLFVMSSSFASSITLVNDSAYELTAIIQTANGKIVAQPTIHPGDQLIWNSDQSSTNLNVEYNSPGSYTPYTVIWRCSYEGYYSVCANASPGATITANTCPGARFCKPKPKKEKKETEKCCTPCQPNNS